MSAETNPNVAQAEKLKVPTDPTVTPPGSRADPSSDPKWAEHVKGYFNQDVTPGEAIPSASHEAKE